MRRPFWIALAALAAAMLVAGGMALAQGEGGGYGPGYGPGMMWGGGGGYGRGRGPGMMGGGYGGGMMGYGSGYGMGFGFGMGPAFRELPAAKQDELRKLQVSTQQAMVAMMADMQAKAEAYQDAISKFPIDQAAAKKAHEAMRASQDQMFALHLATLAQAQQIIGKETWDKLQSEYGGYGPGRGGPGGMMGPGGRGPAR